MPCDRLQPATKQDDQDRRRRVVVEKGRNEKAEKGSEHVVV